jgi:hypothetical protein
MSFDVPSEKCASAASWSDEADTGTLVIARDVTAGAVGAVGIIDGDRADVPPHAVAASRTAIVGSALHNRSTQAEVEQAMCRDTSQACRRASSFQLRVARRL